MIDHRTFLHSAFRAGLLKSSDLRTMRRDFHELRRRQITESDRLSLVTAYLIEKKLLTKWQCDVLASGRHRGFILLGKYRLLDFKGRDATGASYLAETLDSGERVDVHVTRDGSSRRVSIRRGNEVVEETTLHKEDMQKFADCAGPSDLRNPDHGDPNTVKSKNSSE